MTKDGQLNLFDLYPDRTCGACYYFRQYVCGLGDIYHGTMCTVNAPLAVNLEDNHEACERFEPYGEEDKTE